MAITFIERTKRQKRLILVFVFVVLITSIILWKGYFAPKKPVEEITPEITPFKKPEINFEVLKNPILKELEFFERILPSEKIGRENPFEKY